MQLGVCLLSKLVEGSHPGLQGLLGLWRDSHHPQPLGEGRVALEGRQDSRLTGGARSLRRNGGLDGPGSGRHLLAEEADELSLQSADLLLRQFCAKGIGRSRKEGKE